MTILRQPGGTWDEHRNTSRVFPVPPTALPAALNALRAFRRNEEAHYAWVIDGYPNLTEADHRARFGCDYVKAKPKRQT